MNKLLSILKYLLTAKSKHVIKSPYAHTLVNDVIHDKKRYEQYEIVEKIKNELKNSNQVIERKDLGTEEQYSQ